jgi:hypothetical protein
LALFCAKASPFWLKLTFKKGDCRNSIDRAKKGYVQILLKSITTRNATKMKRTRKIGHSLWLIRKCANFKNSHNFGGLIKTQKLKAANLEDG